MPPEAAEIAAAVDYEALRERNEDILLLFQHFAEAAAQRQRVVKKHQNGDGTREFEE